MPLFEYCAVDDTGKAHEGRIEEVSARQVTQVLQERGLQVSTVKRVDVDRGLFSLHRPLRWQDVDLLNEQLLSITQGGLPLVPSLESLAKDLHNPRLQRVLLDIKASLEDGSTLEEAFQRHSDSFSPVYLSMLRAGERSGNLSGVLELMTTYSKRMMEVRNRLQEVFAYPTVVLIASFMIMAFLLVKIIPAYTSFFHSMNSNGNWVLQIWIGASEVIRFHPIEVTAILVVLIAGSYIALRMMRRTYSGALALDRMLLRIPVLGGLFRNAALARFTRSFGLLLASRVPVAESLDLAGAASGSPALRAAVGRASMAVSQGRGLADSLGDCGLFNHTFCWMLASGESRGDVNDTLLSLADLYDRELKRYDRLLITYLGPLILVFLGIIIGSMFFAIYAPIMGLAT